uniref:Uncharacterized protein n=1 Tax=viral metagenome TaxID=1070528 RepID=A0A6H1Z6W8_9ZZZZ
MPTTWTPEQNGNTGRMIFVDNEVIDVDALTHLVDESDIFNKIVGGSLTWLVEQNGNTGRMIWVDNETVYVDSKRYYIDEATVFTKEPHSPVYVADDEVNWIDVAYLADGTYLADGSIHAGVQVLLH